MIVAGGPCPNRTSQIKFCHFDQIFRQVPANSPLAMSVKRKSTVPQAGQKKPKIVAKNGSKVVKANKPIPKKIEESDSDDLDEDEEFHGFGEEDSDENNDLELESEVEESEEYSEEESEEGESDDKMAVDAPPRPPKSSKTIKPDSGTLSNWLQLTLSQAKGSPRSCCSKSAGKGAKASKAKWFLSSFLFAYISCQTPRG